MKVTVLFDRSEIEEKLNQAVGLLLENDGYLLEEDVNERSISHRLAIYIEKLFPDWDVDCEYNRNIGVTKKLDIYASKTVPMGDTEARTVYPDIVVHQRGTYRNLLVIEIKKTTSTASTEGSKFDKLKLRAFKDELKYDYAVALRLRTGCEHYGVDEPEFIN